LGDSRKYPYPTAGGMNILSPLAFVNSEMLYLSWVVDASWNIPEHPRTLNYYNKYEKNM